MTSHFDIIDNSYLFIYCYYLFKEIGEHSTICYNVMTYPSSGHNFYVIYKLKSELLCYLESYYIHIIIVNVHILCHR